MRIIAGDARGARILSPKGTDTRPTLDRVRESLFSIIAPWLYDSRVLDLFAGSGALGLEALSRGADEAVFVDHSRQAADVISRNIEKLRFEKRATVLRRDWQGAVKELKERGSPFDVVFLDPPYDMRNTGDIAGRLMQAGLLSRGALISIERAAASPPHMPPGFKPHGPVRHYGETDIHIYVCEP